MGPLRCCSVTVLSIVFGVSSATLGCSDAASKGDGTSGLSPETVQALEGLYGIESHLQNPAACTVGSPVADGPAYLVLVAGKILGQEVLEVVSCRDLAGCAELAAAIRSEEGYGGYDFSYTLSEEEREGVLSGFLANTGFSDGAGTCTERTVERVVLTSEGADITLVAEVRLLEDQPEEDGYCMVEPAKALAEADDAPCVRQVDLRATHLDDL